MILCICPFCVQYRIWGSDQNIRGPFDQKITRDKPGWTDVSGHGGDVKPAGLHKVGGVGGGGVRVLLWPLLEIQSEICQLSRDKLGKTTIYRFSVVITFV